MKGYVYWELRTANGINDHGKQQYRNAKSSVHLRNEHTNIRTACNLRIPDRANVMFEANKDELPKDLKHCLTCFK